MKEIEPVNWKNYQKLFARVLSAFFLFGLPLIISLALSFVANLNAYQISMLLGITGIWWGVVILVMGKP